MLATVDIIEIAKTTGCKAHICHVSSPDVAQKIKEAQQEGYDITAETCSHYLSMTDKTLSKTDHSLNDAPPLRSQEEVDRLWSYVEDGTISGIASDHSPCSYDEKFHEILGKGSRMSLTYGEASVYSEWISGSVPRRLCQEKSLSVCPRKCNVCTACESLRNLR